MSQELKEVTFIKTDRGHTTRKDKLRQIFKKLSNPKTLKQKPEFLYQK